MRITIQVNILCEKCSEVLNGPPYSTFKQSEERAYDLGVKLGWQFHQSINNVITPVSICPKCRYKE